MQNHIIIDEIHTSVINCNSLVVFFFRSNSLTFASLNDMSMEKSCPECGNKIIGRADKKFCSDACRNSYNNQLNKDSNNLVRNINNRLRKNYRILEGLNPEEKTKVSRQKLNNAGFDFNFFTSIYTTKAGTIYYFVYDQGYLAINEGEFYALVKRKMK